MQSMKVTVPHSQVKQANLMLLQIDKNKDNPATSH
jgi:hypothetical protein